MSVIIFKRQNLISNLHRLEREKVMRQLCKIIQSYITQQGYNPTKLARVAAVPRSTIVNWLEGNVTKPRYWHDLIKVAAAMKLDLEEVNTASDGMVKRSADVSSNAAKLMALARHLSNMAEKLNKV